MYIYESHMGGYYVSDEFLRYEELYCEECGDSDTLIGFAESKEDALEILRSEGTCDENYIKEFVNTNFAEDKLD